MFIWAITAILLGQAYMQGDEEGQRDLRANGEEAIGRFVGKHGNVDILSRIDSDETSHKVHDVALQEAIKRGDIKTLEALRSDRIGAIQQKKRDGKNKHYTHYALNLTDIDLTDAFTVAAANSHLEMIKEYGKNCDWQKPLWAANNNRHLDTEDYIFREKMSNEQRKHALPQAIDLLKWRVTWQPSTSRN